MAAMQGDSKDGWLIDDTTETTGPATENQRRPWKILIVDDEPDVHSTTRLALRDVRYRGRSLELLSAYSGQEGFAVFSQNPDIAIVLLDVVMETDDAGLRLAERIRTELANPLVRIVLRTGQPGQAPEEKVIVDFDINDYKSKTDLTARRLFVMVVASLRTYESLMVIEASRQGLRRILKGAENLYQFGSLREFSSGVLSQVSAILDVGADGILCAKRARSGKGELESDFEVVAGTGRYADLPELGRLSDDHPFTPLINKAFEIGTNHHQHPHDVMHFSAQNGDQFVIVVTPPWPLEDFQKDLLGVFCDRIASAFDNLFLYQQLSAASEATVIALADLAEFRDESTGRHIVRMKQLTDAIVSHLRENGTFVEEISDTFKAMIGTASILHDVGKVTTPDNILLKPGVHTVEERDVMKEHAAKGEVILDRAAKLLVGDSYLSYGAQIAGSHHERYDGTGYPKGLKGTEIPLASRIVAVVDVFDALVHRRLYKEPWPIEQAIDYVRTHAGTQFDPDVVAAFLSVVERNPREWVEPEEM